MVREVPMGVLRAQSDGSNNRLSCVATRSMSYGLRVLTRRRWTMPWQAGLFLVCLASCPFLALKCYVHALTSRQ